MHRQGKMIYLRHVLAFAFSLAAMGTPLAVQDPKASATQLDSRIAAIESELTKVDKQLANQKLPASERRALHSKRVSLAREQRALAQDRARNEKIANNPLVVYGDDAPPSAQANRIDGLFK
jgi:hypothetical protein